MVMGPHALDRHLVFDLFCLRFFSGSCNLSIDVRRQKVLMYDEIQCRRSLKSAGTRNRIN